jgi:hypothetical protein
MFAGRRLDRIIGWDNKVALIGDSSHPLSGKSSFTGKYILMYKVLIMP